MLSHVSIEEIKEHYLTRELTHKELLNLFKTKQLEKYARLAIGITKSTGNYSAHEHALGPNILEENTAERIFNLAEELFACKSANHIPNIIYKFKLSYLKISVGSEMAMMLRPNVFWVGNVRTIWTQLLTKHNCNYNRANEELELYKDSDRTSEMDYQIWRDIYLSLQKSLDELIKLGNEKAAQQNVKPGSLKYLWADAIASALYDKRN